MIGQRGCRTWPQAAQPPLVTSTNTVCHRWVPHQTLISFWGAEFDSSAVGGGLSSADVEFCP